MRGRARKNARTLSVATCAPVGMDWCCSQTTRLVRALPMIGRTRNEVTSASSDDRSPARGPDDPCVDESLSARSCLRRAATRELCPPGERGRAIRQVALAVGARNGACSSLLFLQCTDASLENRGVRLDECHHYMRDESPSMDRNCIDINHNDVNLGDLTYSEVVPM